MLALIFTLLVGAGLVYISTFNSMLVSVNFGFFIIADIPLFYVILGSLVTGLILSYGIYVINGISNSIRFRAKDKEIKKNKGEVLELARRVHQLELENEKIKNGTTVENVDENAL